MIGSLRGRLLDRATHGELLIDVGGMGYRVQVAPAAALTLGEVGGEVFVHVHHHVREDADTLYGFAGLEERRCFEALLGAHGVGPSLAMAILSVHDPRALAAVVDAGDLDALCLVPGVGRKTAQRLLVELKGVVASNPDRAEETSSGPDGGQGAHADVRAALAGLGYGPDEIRSALGALAGTSPAEDPGQLLRLALQHLAVAR